MNPIDAPVRDFSLYYNHTYMLHVDRGPVHVTVSEHQLRYRKNENDRWVNTSANMITCLWPQPRSLNLGEHAEYIARKSSRSARRSATLNHYYRAWDEFDQEHHTLSNEITNRTMRQLHTPGPYPTMFKGYNLISQGAQLSVAVSRDFILFVTGTGRVNVICQGHFAGHILREKHSYVFTPSDELNPVCQRAMFKLQKEGLLCL